MKTCSRDNNDEPTPGSVGRGAPGDGRFQVLAGQAPVAIFEADRAGQYRFVNPRWCELAGLTAESAQGDGWGGAIHPGDRDQVLAGWRRAVESGTWFDIRARVLGPGAAMSLVRISAHPVIAPEGEITGFVGTYTDESESHRAAERARRLHELVTALAAPLEERDAARTALEVAMAASAAEAGVVVLTTPDGTTLELACWSGYRAATMAAFQRVPLDAKLPLAEAARRRAMIEVGSRAELLARYPQLAGYPQPPEREALVSMPLGTGDCIGAMALSFARARRFSDGELDFLRSISEQCAHAIHRTRLAARRLLARRQAEAATARTQRLLDLTAALAAASSREQIAAILVSAGNHAVGADAGFVWLLADGADQPLELVASEGYEGPRLDAFRRIPAAAELPINRAMATGQAMYFEGEEALESKYPQTRAGGDGPFRSWALVPLVIDGRAVGAVSLSFADERRFDDDERGLLAVMVGQASLALERARLLSAERSARQQAEVADRRKDEFLAMLGHELRNPLAPILTALELMRLRDGDSHARERAVVERQVRHLTRLVDDLLDVSRISSGKLTLDRRLVDIADTVAKALEMVRPLIEERDQTLSLSVPAEGLQVKGDEQRLAQVISNLLTNAAKYTQRGGAITLTAERREGEAVIDITDTGIGISTEVQSRLFCAFEQGPRSSAEASGGLGLGLAIVRSLVELHGGTVSARSQGPGHGSTFEVRLPVVEGAAPTSHTAAAAPRVAEPRPGPRPRALIVDDNRDAAETLAEALGQLGFETRVSFDGHSAIATAADFVPDVALLDIGLPVMDGHAVARELRQVPALGKMKLVAVTGYGQAADHRRSRDSGFDEHLVKPIDLGQLRSLLTQIAKV